MTAALILAGSFAVLSAVALVLIRTIRSAVYSGYSFHGSVGSFELKPPVKARPAPAAAGAISAPLVPAAPMPAPVVSADADGEAEPRMTRKEAATALGVSEMTVRRRAGEWGLRETPHLGRATTITAASVQALIDARKGDRS